MEEPNRASSSKTQSMLFSTERQEKKNVGNSPGEHARDRRPPWTMAVELLPLKHQSAEWGFPERSCECWGSRGFGLLPDYGPKHFINIQAAKYVLCYYIIIILFPKTSLSFFIEKKKNQAWSSTKLFYKFMELQKLYFQFIYS